MIFLISLLIIIFLHELGHLLVAKACKCDVEKFSIGFGKCIFGFSCKNTFYQIALFPLGGYCKLKDELKYSQNSRAFTNLSYSKKCYIVLAGCAVNCFCGIIGLLLGRILENYYYLYFGYISLCLGISNLIPFPALDGSYPFLVLLEKFYGKEKGYKLMESICKVGFIILMTINVLCLPYLILLIIHNRL